MELDKIIKDFTVQGPNEGKRSYMYTKVSLILWSFCISSESVEGDDLLDLMDNL